MLTIKPKTRKEIYLAYLSGDMSIELPEPLTRDEVNLYNLCKNKAYGEYTTVKEVLAETTLTATDESGQLYLHEPAKVTVGEQYIVTWNGVDYPCTATELEGFPALVNEGADLSTGENCVFAIMLPGADMGGGVCGIVMAMGATSATFSIRQEVETVTKLSGKYVEGMGYEEDGTIHPIDPKYLPSGGGGGVTMYYGKFNEYEDYLYKDIECTTPVTKTELEAKYKTSSIFVYWGNEYQDAVLSPLYVTNFYEQGYMQVRVKQFDEEYALFTAEWSKSAGPQ